MSELESSDQVEDKQDKMRAEVRRAEQLEPLFVNFMSDKKNSAAQNALLEWSMKELIDAAERKYLSAAWSMTESRGDWQKNAQERAANVVIRIWKKLERNKFLTYQDLLGYIGESITYFWRDAQADKIGSEQFDSLETSSEDGSDDDSDHEDAEAKQQRARMRRAPANRAERPSIQESVLQKMMSQKDQEFRRALAEVFYDRTYFLHKYSMKDNTLDQKIKRYKDKMLELKLLMASFHLPPESQYMLTKRFEILIGNLMQLPKAKLPKTFAEAIAMASNPACLTGKVRNTPQQVTRHLLKLLRQEPVSDVGNALEVSEAA
jgi:hypothetical protein